MPLLTFQPDSATSDAILQAIAADYSLSLTDIAAQHQTTIEALTAWLTREDIDERLTAIESACARRARLTAANHLPAVAHVAKQALEEASDVLRLPPDYRTQHSIALRIRATESARRAAALLLRIANFTPGPRRVRHQAEPATPRITPPPALTSAPHAEIAPMTSPSAPPAECAHAAPAAAPRTETAPSAPSSAKTSATPTDSTPTTSLSAPLPESAQRVQNPEPRAASTLAAPTSLPPAESTPSDPISTTSPACTTPAPRAAPPNPTSYSPAIPAWFTLVPASAVPAPNHSPSPNAHPPPTPQFALSAHSATPPLRHSATPPLRHSTS